MDTIPVSGCHDMINKTKLFHTIIIIFFTGVLFNSCGNPVDTGKNQTLSDFIPNYYSPYNWVNGVESGIWWPEDQLLPIFSYPADPMDTIAEAAFTWDERVFFGTLQGLVNREKTRILVTEIIVWVTHLDFSITQWENSKKYELIEKYKDYINGIVLYDVSNSVHYTNLASTIANINDNYVPVTKNVKDKLEEIGIVFPKEKIIDITNLDYETDFDVYEYLYNNYWDQCSKRLIVSINPGPGAPAQQLANRDIAAAVGAAAVFCDVRNAAGKQQYEKFLKDMADNGDSSVVLGWFTDERGGITAASNFGIPSLPADYYRSGSVYSATSHLITAPRVPKRPDLENKVYIALYMSDGDNIQYCQRDLYNMWDRTKNDRGKIAINWTISPSLADIGPGILNYYYENSTEKECFVTGPSGVGYILPLNSQGTPKNYLTDEKYAADYTRMTEIYLQKTGIRIITLWDGATDIVRRSYERHCRNLYGVTVQDWNNRNPPLPETASSTENGRLRFEYLRLSYANSYELLHNTIVSDMEKWDGNSPVFLGYQLRSWTADLTTANMVGMETELREEFPGKDFDFVRADHFFSYFNEFNNLPINLCMLSSTQVITSDENQNPEFITDGTTATLWVTKKTNTNTFLNFDFKNNYIINRYVIRHAESSGENKTLNNKSWKVEISTDGQKWTTVETYRNNSLAVSDIEIKPVSARYVKITILDPGGIDAVRIAEVEIYGKNF